MAPDAVMHLERTATLAIGSHSTVFVEDGGQLRAEVDSHIRVEGGGLLSVQTQAEADALQTDGQLQLLPGGQLQIRDTGVVLTGRPSPQLELYPNPTNSQQVCFSLRETTEPTKELYSYRLLTAQGTCVQRGRCAQGSTTLSGVPAGSYLLELTAPSGQRLTRRLFVTP